MANLDEDIYFTLVTQPGYDTTSKAFRLAHGNLSSSDTDTIALKEHEFLSRQSEHAIRNNILASSALDKYILSLGIIKVKWKRPDGSEHTKMQKLWNDDFIKNPTFDKYGNFGTYQALCNKSIFTSGNSFTQWVVPIRYRKDFKVPIRLKPLQTVLWDITYTGETGENNVRYGCRIDSENLIQSYFFKDNRYNEIYNKITNINKSIEIDVYDIIHSFYRDYPGQIIGIPKLATGLILLYNVDDLNDATIQKQKAAQAIAWLIEDSNPATGVRTAIGTPIETIDDNDEKKIKFLAQGGNVQYLNKGQKPHFYQSTDIGPNLGVLLKKEAEKLAAYVGIPYHELSGDTEGLNYATIRALSIALRARINYIHHIHTIPLNIQPIAEKYHNIAQLYVNGISDAIPHYNLPKYYGADPLKDTQENVLALISGLEAYENLLEEQDITIDQVKQGWELIKKEIPDIGNSLLNKNSNLSAQSNNIESNRNSAN